jgi:hypothetical protein
MDLDPDPRHPGNGSGSCKISFRIHNTDTIIFIITCNIFPSGATFGDISYTILGNVKEYNGG